MENPLRPQIREEGILVGTLTIIFLGRQSVARVMCWTGIHLDKRGEARLLERRYFRWEMRRYEKKSCRARI